MKKDFLLHATCGCYSYSLALNYRNTNFELTIWDTEWLRPPFFKIQRIIFKKRTLFFYFMILLLHIVLNQLKIIFIFLKTIGKEIHYWL